MKRLLYFLLCTVFGLSISLQAQSGISNPRSNGESERTPGNDVKSRFIENQDYLRSLTSVKTHESLYRDSLRGFDEATVRNMLLAKGISGKEFLYSMNFAERHFINNKYHIGANAGSPALPPPNMGGKPGPGGGNQVNVAPCVNEDFELTPPGAYALANSVAGWTIESQAANPSFIIPPYLTYGGACTSYTSGWVSGSPEFSIVATPILGNPAAAPFSINNITIGNSPLGGNNIARLNNSSPTGLMTRLMQTFPVTQANTLFQFAYCGSWDGVHECCGQPFFNIYMYDCPGNLLACSNVSLTPSGGQCISGVPGYSVTNGVSWTNWKVNYIDLTPFVGTCVTIIVTNGDCSYSGHHGTAYFDSRCGGALVGSGLGGNGGSIGGPVSFCAGSNQAQISAPLGYSQYQWFAPPTGAAVVGNGGNTANLNINNPVPGTVYTVQLVTASGCTFTALDTLKFSTVSIIGIGSNSTCPGGASGTATVQGNGSGSGYNYSWYGPASPNTVIGTASVIAGLGPGIYTIGISGFGAAGCGSAVATVTIGTSPPNIYSVIKPYCGNEAYMIAGGSNFQWYNGLSAISPTAGGTAAGYTATAPYNGQIYWLTYTSPQNCRDSVQFLLSQTAPGTMGVSNISYACPGVGNATANITLNPAQNSPPGQNSYSVFSTSALPNPVYTASLFPTANTNFIPTGMPAGTYSVIGFDGSCKYNTTFVVQNYLYNYTVGPLTSTLCPGNTLLPSVSFSVPITATQYNFQWSPATWVVGGAANTTNISMQLAPVIPSGSVVTTVYTIVVTPTVVNCPITKTISVTAVNLQVPTFAPIPAFCTNAAAKTITATPPGGSFSTGMGNWLGTFNGVITPGLIGSIGTNTFMYSVSISTCAISSIGSFNVAQFNTAALSGTILPQCTTNPCVNLMGIVNSTVNGAWSGSGVNPANNTFCANTPLTPGIYKLTYNTTSTPFPGLCPDTRTINVSVSAPVQPTITPVQPFCTNIPSFNMAVSPGGGNWSSSVLQLITPAGVLNTFNAPLGTTVLNYAVFTGACLNTATTSIDATKFYSAALVGVVPPLCTNSQPFGLMNIVQNQINGSWSTSNAPGHVVNNIFYPAASPTNPVALATGTYQLVYKTTSAPNPLVCPDSCTITVSVLNPATPTIVPQVPHCNVDAPFQILANPATGSFVATQYLTADGWFTPAMSPVGMNAVQFVIGTNTCNVSSTQLISIEGFVPPTITGSIPDQCNTNASINLNSLVLNNTGSWTGPGILGNSFNPSNSPTGVVALTYNTSSIPSGLCPAQATLAVKVFSLATPAITQAGPLCNSNPGVQLKVTPLGGYFGGENTAGVTASGWFNPSTGSIGDNIVSYSVTSGPCTAFTKVTIKVEKFVSADFSKYAGPFCRNGAPIDLNSIVQNPGGVFSGPNMDGSIFTPSKANIGTGNFIAYYTHSSPTESLCPDSSAIRLQVNDVPQVSIASHTNMGCAPINVNFSTPSTGAGKGEWVLGDGSEKIEGLATMHTYTAAGTYSVTFNYWDELGCMTQTILSTPIRVFGPPEANFTYGPYQAVTISDPEVQFTNQSTELGKNTYDWKIADLYNLTDVNPVVKFPKIGRYDITLTATTIHGCKDRVTQTIEVINDFGIYIPNSFTPNDDDLNDTFGPIFSPYGLDEKTFDMEIFDRWGNSLYHTKDVHKGWDGSINNKGDDKLKTEVYVYKIKYKDMDGVIYNKLGHVSMIR